MNRALIIGAFLLVGCEQAPPPPAKVGSGSTEEHEQELIATNRAIAEREERDIEDWLRRQGVAMDRTGTGIHIKLVRDSSGVTVKPLQMVAVNFSVLLLNGTVCYTSEPGTPFVFRVEEDDVASGLHEGIQHLSPGDSAVIVIPSHRAFGLIGDQQKIPMRSTVVYRIGLVKSLP
jgi:FKBP-type peptidyl-prolyl cis-trans isomerase FkpA